MHVTFAMEFWRVPVNAAAGFVGLSASFDEHHQRKHGPLSFRQQNRQNE